MPELTRGYDGSRTDAIIVMSIDKSNGDIRLISVMRDSYLRMGYFDGSLILDKITHAHHYAGGVNTCAALNRSLDLNIEEFIIFNWKAVSDAVDCLGGVEINVKQNEIDDMNTYGNETARNVGGTYTAITQAGEQTLDGVQATILSNQKDQRRRRRKKPAIQEGGGSSDEESDYSAVEAQGTVGDGIPEYPYQYGVSWRCTPLVLAFRDMS